MFTHPKHLSVTPQFEVPENNHVGGCCPVYLLGMIRQLNSCIIIIVLKHNGSILAGHNIQKLMHLFINLKEKEVIDSKENTKIEKEFHKLKSISINVNQ